MDIQYVPPFGIRPEEALFLLLPIRRLWWTTDLASDFRHALHQNPLFQHNSSYSKIKSSFENVLLHKRSVVDRSCINSDQ